MATSCSSRGPSSRTNDRAIATGQTTGFCKGDGGQGAAPVGEATIVGPQAGDLIQIWALGHRQPY